MYPLSEQYIPPIQSFIDQLNSYPELKVIENTMSTQVYGEYARVLEIVNIEMQKAHTATPKAAFVLKVLNGDLSPDA